jgi:hypothetical protein
MAFFRPMLFAAVLIASTVFSGTGLHPCTTPANLRHGKSSCPTGSDILAVPIGDAVHAQAASGRLSWHPGQTVRPAVLQLLEPAWRRTFLVKQSASKSGFLTTIRCLRL